jgi:hypothetical protein
MKENITKRVQKFVLSCIVVANDNYILTMDWGHKALETVSKNKRNRIKQTVSVPLYVVICSNAAISLVEKWQNLMTKRGTLILRVYTKINYTYCLHGKWSLTRLI